MAVALASTEALQVLAGWDAVAASEGGTQTVLRGWIPTKQGPDGRIRALFACPGPRQARKHEMQPCVPLDQFRYRECSNITSTECDLVLHASAASSASPKPYTSVLNSDCVVHVLAQAHECPCWWRNGKEICNWSVTLAMYGVSRAWRNGVFNALRQVYGFEARQAHAFLDVLVGRHNVFLTGPAGSGKSYVVDCLREAIVQLEGAAKQGRLVVLAPTGIAAVNVGGRTICSFCGMRPKTVDKLAMGFWPEAWPETQHVGESPLIDEAVAQDGEFDEVEEAVAERGTTLMVPLRPNTVQLRYPAVRRVIVDEVSMADEFMMRQLELVIGDAVGRDRPFERVAGERFVQLVLVGDFAQLPPVYERDSLKERALRDGTLCKYLFQSSMWAELRLREHALTIVKRTDHAEYLQVLSELRDGDPLVGERLSRMRAVTRAHERGGAEEDLALFGRHWPDRSITDDAQRARFPCVVNWNERKMAELTTPPLDFFARAEPDFEDPRAWTPKMPPNVVRLKKGCTVMVTRNMWACPRDSAKGDEDDENDENEGGLAGTSLLLAGRRVANGSIGTFVGQEDDGERLQLRFPEPKGAEGDTFTVAVGQTEYHASRRRQAGECNRTCPARRSLSGPASTVPHAKGCPRHHFRATKRQFAVTPSFGITIHKSQGQTLRQHFVVRIDQSWDAGQLYVALSRAAHPKLMRLAGNSSDAKRSATMRADVAAVRNFHAHIPAPPSYVV